jgi:hypothetical protein
MAQPGTIYHTSKHIRVAGNPTCVSGSSPIPRDISENVSWWGVGNMPHVFGSMPVDEFGKPMRLCSRCGQYVKRAGFSKDSTRPSGLDCYCKNCRHLQYMASK